MAQVESIAIGPLSGILHVNRQLIAMNKRDGGNRPCFTLKPNGPNSTAIYCRNAVWNGPSEAVGSEDQLSCGAVAWIKIGAGTVVALDDRMSFEEAKNFAA